MQTVKHICFWIVDRSIAIDLHAENGELIRPAGFDEPIMASVPATSSAEREQRGWTICTAIAQSHGLDRENVSYDADSTQFFAKGA